MSRIFVTGCTDALQAAAGYNGVIVDCTSADWSAKRFVNQGRLAKVYDQLTAGDMLLVQYGANDMDAKDMTGYSQPGDEFEGYLERFVNVAHNKRATPVFLAPALPGGEAWQESCRSLAWRLKVECVRFQGGKEADCDEG